MMKVMTFNVKNGGQDDFDFTRLSSIISLIQSEGPDVLALQELMYADLNKCRNLLTIENSTGMRSFLAPARTGQHVAVLVRKEARVTGFESDNVNYHHAMAEVTLETNRGPLTVIGTHLCPHGGENRLGEVQRLANKAKAHRMVLLMGDLNSLDPWTDHRESVADLPTHYRSRHLMPGSTDKIDTRAIATLSNAGYRDFHRHLGNVNKAHTAPTKHGGGIEFSHMRVDYILGTDPLVPLLKHLHVGDVAESESASDHYHVVAELDLDLA